MKRVLLAAACILISVPGLRAQSVVHPRIGTEVKTDSLDIRIVGKKQYFHKGDTLTADENIRSPKSVNVSPDGSRFYVNSLEGFKTVIFDTKTFRRLGVVDHSAVLQVPPFL